MKRLTETVKQIILEKDGNVLRKKGKCVDLNDSSDFLMACRYGNIFKTNRRKILDLKWCNCFFCKLENKNLNNSQARIYGYTRRDKCIAEMSELKLTETSAIARYIEELEDKLSEKITAETLQDKTNKALELLVKLNKNKQTKA